MTLLQHPNFLAHTRFVEECYENQLTGEVVVVIKAGESRATLRFPEIGERLSREQATRQVYAAWRDLQTVEDARVRFTS